MVGNCIFLITLIPVVVEELAQCQHFKLMNCVKSADCLKYRYANCFNDVGRFNLFFMLIFIFIYAYICLLLYIYLHLYLHRTDDSPGKHYSLLISMESFGQYNTQQLPWHLKVIGHMMYMT